MHVLELIQTIQSQVAALFEPWPEIPNNAFTQLFAVDLEALEGDLYLTYRYQPDFSKERVRVVVLRLFRNYDAEYQSIRLNFNVEGTDGKVESHKAYSHGYSCHPPGPGMAASTLSAAIYMFLCHEVCPEANLKTFTLE